jgi:hypothetical protein
MTVRSSYYDGHIRSSELSFVYFTGTGCTSISMSDHIENQVPHYISPMTVVFA